MKKIDVGSVAEIVGFFLLIGGVSAFSVPLSAIVAGVLLIVFGGIRQ